MRPEQSSNRKRRFALLFQMSEICLFDLFYQIEKRYKLTKGTPGVGNQFAEPG